MAPILRHSALGHPVFAACVIVLFLHGCATAPRQKDSLGTIALHGTTYYPLVSLCEQRSIAWDYDPVTQKVLLQRDANRAAARVGDTIALVDNRVISFRDPVDLHNAQIVVPESFKKQVIETVFKGQNALTARACPLPRFKKIVIDAGHGGKDPGAIGRSGVQEKDVNLDVARRLAKLLAQNGVEVVMTRSTDVFIPLPGRHEIANRARADLFVSVHSNSSRTRSMNGFEVYYVCPTVSDIARAKEAAAESPLKLEASSSYGDSGSLRTMLWDMLLTSARAESIVLSRAVCSSAERELGTNILGVKPARFEVLKGSRMPAVLIEIGFLSHAAEERKLGNNFYRQKVAEAIADGILGYAHTAAPAQES